MDTVKEFLPKIRGVFSIFKKGEARPCPSRPSMCTPGAQSSLFVLEKSMFWSLKRITDSTIDLIWQISKVKKQVYETIINFLAPS